MFSIATLIGGSASNSPKTVPAQIPPANNSLTISSPPASAEITSKKRRSKPKLTLPFQPRPLKKLLPKQLFRNPLSLEEANAVLSRIEQQTGTPLSESRKGHKNTAASEFEGQTLSATIIIGPESSGDRACNSGYDKLRPSEGGSRSENLQSCHIIHPQHRLNQVLKQNNQEPNIELINNPTFAPPPLTTPKYPLSQSVTASSSTAAAELTIASPTATEARPEAFCKNVTQRQLKAQQTRALRRAIGAAKPSNAFILYRRDRSTEILSKFPHLHALRDVSRVVSQLWKKESIEVREEYAVRAAILKGEFEKLHGVGYRRRNKILKEMKKVELFDREEEREFGEKGTEEGGQALEVYLNIRDEDGSRGRMYATETSASGSIVHMSEFLQKVLCE